MGAHNIKDYAADPNVQVLSVILVVPHPGHDGTINDIALLYLASNITFDDNIQPICPPSNSYDYNGQECIVVGWGALNSYVGNSTHRVGK